MEAFRSALYSIVDGNEPCSVRQVYYIGIGRLYDKGDAAYNSVVRELGIMRESGELPWDWISDHTRLRRIATMHNSIHDALRRTAEFYRRDLWSRQPRRVEVWCESDSIGGVLDGVTRPMGVALLAARGQSSKTFAYAAAMEYRLMNKPVTVLYVGDWDPFGLAVDRSLRERLDRYTAGLVEIDFRRLAVVPSQIVEHNLVSHDVNLNDKSYHRFALACHAAGVPAAAVEVEAMPPPALRDLLQQAIEDEVEDIAQWNATLAAEQSERDIISRMAREVGQ